MCFPRLQQLDINHNTEFCDKYWTGQFLLLQRLDISLNPEFCNIHQLFQNAQILKMSIVMLKKFLMPIIQYSETHIQNMPLCTYLFLQSLIIKQQNLGADLELSMLLKKSMVLNLLKNVASISSRLVDSSAQPDSSTMRQSSSFLLTARTSELQNQQMVTFCSRPSKAQSFQPELAKRALKQQ